MLIITTIYFNKILISQVAIEQNVLFDDYDKRFTRKY